MILLKYIDISIYQYQKKNDMFSDNLLYLYKWYYLFFATVYVNLFKLNLIIYYTTQWKLDLEVVVAPSGYSHYFVFFFFWITLFCKLISYYLLGYISSN